LVPKDHQYEMTFQNPNAVRDCEQVSSEKRHENLFKTFPILLAKSADRQVNTWHLQSPHNRPASSCRREYDGT